jgi:hypothetical protein
MRTLLAMALGTGLLVGMAHATPPFGGDDTGFVSPDKVQLICSQKVLQLGTKTDLKIMKCHNDLAADALAGQGIGNSEEACENAATSKLDGKLNALFAKYPCAPCLTGMAATLGADIEGAADTALDDKFCEGTVSFADIGQADDEGFVPPDATVYKCEASVAKNLAKLALCISKCHIKMAKYVFVNRAFDEEACESTDPLRSCRVKYNRIRDKVAPICPACLDSATQDALADAVETNADASLGDFYCASPSGAFIE